MQPYYYDGADNTEVLRQVSAQLMSALATLENLQEGELEGVVVYIKMIANIAGNQLKTAEKRRNKFEFIRFGRK